MAVGGDGRQKRGILGGNIRRLAHKGFKSWDGDQYLTKWGCWQRLCNRWILDFRFLGR
jgi:hypothetical protein